MIRRRDDSTERRYRSSSILVLVWTVSAREPRAKRLTGVKNDPTTSLKLDIPRHLRVHYVIYVPQRERLSTLGYSSYGATRSH